MQYITPKASFSLKCNDISLSDTFADYPISNQVGTINATRTVITWYSINLENILGDLYDQYDLFNLRLRYTQNNVQNAFGVGADDRAIYFQMSGLNWYYSNYDVSRGCNVGTSIIGSNVFTQNTATNTVFDDACIFTIRKQKTADITISYLNANNVAPNMNPNTQFPRTAFYFDLTPIIPEIPKSIELSNTKCASLYSYYLGTTTQANNIDMYAVLGRENFKLGDKYNLVFKFAQASVTANYVASMDGFMFLVSSSGMRFQNYETAIGKAAGNSMQMVTYNAFQGSIGTTLLASTVRAQTSGIMTFRLESQICNLIIQVQNTTNNTENGVNIGNILVTFDIWKCI